MVRGIYENERIVSRRNQNNGGRGFKCRFAAFRELADASQFPGEINQRRVLVLRGYGMFPRFGQK
jgi:hypothetical protein